MNQYKNNYGYQIAGTLSAFWLWASILNMPELLEISGALIIIQSMWIWKYDFKNYKFSESPNSLAEIKTTLREIIFKYQQSTENMEANSYNKLAESIQTLTTEIKDLKVEVVEAKNEELIEKINNLHDAQLIKYLEQIIYIGEQTSKKLDEHMKLVSNFITLNDNEEIIRDSFISIEFLLITCGTIYWACGSYIYNGWYGLYSVCFQS